MLLANSAHSLFRAIPRALRLHRAQLTAPVSPEVFFERRLPVLSKQEGMESSDVDEPGCQECSGHMLLGKSRRRNGVDGQVYWRCVDTNCSGAAPI